jgi:hypothetical protein
MIRKKPHRKGENVIHDNRIVGEQFQAGAASALGNDSAVQSGPVDASVRAEAVREELRYSYTKKLEDMPVGIVKQKRKPP